MSTLELEAPANLETEGALLGAILLDHELLDEAASIDPAAFTLDSHRRIFMRMRKMAEAGQKIDTVTLLSSLHDAKEVAAVGGAAYLCSLTDGLPRKLHVHEYVGILRKKWLLRQVMQTCSNFAARAADRGEEDPEELIAAADKALLAIAADTRQSLPSIEVQTHAELERMHAQRSGQEVMGYDYGIMSLDRLIGGLVPREMTVLGGRPAQGKSSLIAQLSARHCPRGVPIHVFSCEMSAGQFLRRLWSIFSGIPFHKVRHPERQTPEETRCIENAAFAVSSWPLLIDDVAGITTDQLIARARMSKRGMGTKIVCIDYLQKMRFSTKLQYRYMEVTAAAVAMAALAKEENIALLLLSSVSEKTGKSRNDPPTLQDFRQSGDIAYEASTALLIHREVDESTEKLLEDGQIVVAKARSDDTGAVNVRFRPDYLTFEESLKVVR